MGIPARNDDDGKLVTFDELERLSSVVEPTSPEFCAEATDFPPLGQIAPLARKSVSIAYRLVTSRIAKAKSGFEGESIGYHRLAP